MDTSEIKPDTPEEVSPAGIQLLKKRKEVLRHQMKSYSFVWWGWVLASFIGAVFWHFTFSNLSEKPRDIYDLLKLLFIGAIFGSFTYVYLVGGVRFILSSRLRKVETELIMAGALELQESIDENFFTKLVQINFKYLDVNSGPSCPPASVLS